MSASLSCILDKIDRFNLADPNKFEVNGTPQAYERIYSDWLSAWIRRLMPSASEELQIAAHGQHVGRWTIPRARYEATRGGYLRWREDLKKYHAQTVVQMMGECGYTEPQQNRVRDLILKKLVKTDPEGQALEDGLCLVFLEKQFEEFQKKTAPEKMPEIVRKTWKKMSPQAHEMALALPWSTTQLAFLKKVLAPTPQS